MAKIQIKNSFITSSAQITISSSLVRFSDNIRARGITGSFSGSIAGANVFVQGGNSFGTTATLGTNDNQVLIFETNNTERMRIQTDGNVGIGTTSPVQKFSVVGNIYLPQSNYITWNNGDCEIAGISGYHLVFRTYTGVSMTEKLRIQSDGNVGIGTTTPAAKLDLYNGTDLGSGANGIRVQRPGSYGQYGYLEYLVSSDKTVLGSVYTGGGASSFGQIYFRQHSSTTSRDAMVINTDGNVGIGTTAPINKLHTYSGTGTAQIFNQIQLTNMGTPNIGDIVGIGFAAGESTQYGLKGSIGYVRTGDYGRGAITFYTNNTAGIESVSTSNERMRVAADGNVGIGTTSPNYKLHVSGSITAAGGSNSKFISIVSSGTDRYFLDCYGTSNRQIFALYENSSNVYLNSWSTMAFRANQNGGSGGYFTFSGGNIGVGSTPSGILDIQSSNTGEHLVRTWNTDTSGTGKSILRIANSGNNAQGTQLQFTDLNYYVGTIAVDRTNGMAFYVGQQATPLVSERMRIDINGNVGIGTTTPGYKLELVGTSTGIRVLSTTGDAYVRLTDNGVRNWDLKVVDVSDYFEIGGTTAKSLIVTGAGSVGIGDSAPAYKLDVSGSVRVYGQSGLNGGVILRSSSATQGNIRPSVSNGTVLISDDSSSSTRGLTVNNNGGVTISTANASQNIIEGQANGSQVMCLNYSGNIGLGTSSPSRKLHIKGSTEAITLEASYSGASGIIIGSQYTGTTECKGQIWFLNPDSGYGGALAFATQPNSSGTSATERMRIGSNGNVGIGTTTPNSRFEVSGSSNAAIQAIFQSNAGSSGTIGYLGGIQLGNASSNQNSQIYHNSSGDNTLTFVSNYGSGTSNKFVFAPGGTERVRFQQDGNVGIGTTSPSYRLHVNGGSANVAVGWFEKQSSTDGRIAHFTNSTATGYSSYIYIGSNPGTDWKVGKNVINSGTAGNFQITDHLDNVRFQINAADGNIGIGTTSPLAKLSVGNGSLADGNLPVQISSAGTNTERYFGINKNGSYGLIVGYYEGSSFSGVGAYIRQVSSDPIHFLVNNVTTAMSMISSGNVGIGSSSPIAKLDINGTTNFAANVYHSIGGQKFFAGSGGTHAYFYTGTSVLNFVNSNDTSTLMTISNGGSVGIGTTSPGTLLNVHGANPYVRINDTSATGHGIKISYNNSDTHGLHFTYNANGAQSYIDNTYGVTSGQVYGDIYFRQNVSGVMTTRMTIKADGGSIGIGTTSPAAKLDVNGNVRATSFTGSFSGLPNGYLYARRITSNQTISSGNWANIDLIFNGNVVSSSIKYNSTTGVASLTGGKVYRITSGLSWTNNAAYAVYWSLYKNSNNAMIGPEVSSPSVTYTINVNSPGILEMIYAPTASIDVKIRTTANSSVYGTSLSLSTDNSYIIVQQLA